MEKRRYYKVIDTSKATDVLVKDGYAEINPRSTIVTIENSLPGHGEYVYVCRIKDTNDYFLTGDSNLKEIKVVLIEGVEVFVEDEVKKLFVFNYPASKIQAIKFVRLLCPDIGLKEAKDYVEEIFAEHPF